MSSTNNQQHADQPTVFGSGCHIKGDVTVEGDAAVFGSIEGTTNVTGTLEIAADGGIKGGVAAGAMLLQGRVEGDVHCDGLLELNGRVDGDVTCGKVELGSDSTLVGNLRAKIIAVKEGAIYRGEVIIGPDAMDELPADAPTMSRRGAADEDSSEQDAAHRGNGQHTEPKAASPSRTAVSGLLRRRHELLNK